MFEDTFFENVACSTDETVAVIDIAEWVDYIKLIEFSNSTVKLIEFADIFDRVADVHNPCMEDTAFEWERAV